MVTSFNMFHGHTATLSAPDPAAGHCQATPLLEIPGHWQSSLGQSLVGSLLLFLGPGVHTILFVPSKSLFPQSCDWGKLWWLCVGLMVTSTKRAYATPRSAAPRDPAPAVGHCSPISLQETNTQKQVWLSLCGTLDSWWWTGSLWDWVSGSPKRRCCENAALNMPANLENSAVATGLEKISFCSNPKERQCQRMLKLPHNCNHLTC